MGFDTSAIDKIPSGGPLRTAWKSLAATLSALSKGLEDGKTKWSGLSAQLVASGEMAGIYGAMDAPAEVGEQIATDVKAVAPALNQFADELDGFVSARVKVHAAIDEFNRRWPADKDVGPIDWLRRHGDENRIEGDIRQIEAYLEEAERRVNATLSNGRMSAPSPVPLHYPGGGDTWEVADASSLYRDMASGRSGNAAADHARLRAMLAGFTESQMTQFLRDNPDAFMSVPPQGMDPRANRAWWDSLSDQQRTMLAAAMPGMVGNTEGLTYATRSAANEDLLGRLQKLTPEERAALGISDVQANSYAQIQQSFETGKSKAGEAQIMSFDPRGPSGRPLAAVVIGNLDTATHQSWYIPGMTTDTERMGGMFGDTLQMYGAQRAELGPGESLATVAWVGYDAPAMFSASNHDVFHSGMAEAGGARLENALEGLNAANGYRTTGSTSPYMSVMAHSYGTTTAAYALSDIDFKVNSAVFFGSVGVDPDAATTASGLHIADVPGKPGEPALYAAVSTGDSPSRMGINVAAVLDDPRLSPTSSDFGARVFSVEGTNGLAATDGHDGQGHDRKWYETGRSTAGHGYVDSNTQSLKSIALASTGNAEDGQGDDVEVWNMSEQDEREEQMAYGMSNPGGYGSAGPLPEPRVRK